MAKKIRSVWQLMLGSLIALLGFAACKTAKKAQQNDERLLYYGPPPTFIDKQPIDRVIALYGVPPVKVERVPEIKE